jgi:hypothetical protein
MKNKTKKMTTAVFVCLLMTLTIANAVGQEYLYWKSEYPDYAPSGMPDFDQKQNGWFDPASGKWTFCGPVAVANSLWWLDSEFEPGTVPPPTVSDGFGLVIPYGFWDDHDVNNVQPLVNDLAGYMHTSLAFGTEVHDMKQGIDQYLTDKGMHGYFYSHLLKQPAFEEVEIEVEKCQDVVLLLGFWQEDPPGSGMWWRTGGHYVTVAGVDSSAFWVALSDPYIDAFEAGLVPGRSPVPHPYPHPPEVHNDAQFVSHDMYWAAMPSPSPGGLWGFPDYSQYVLPLDLFYNFERQNCPVEFIQQQMPFNPQLPVYTEVEYAVVTSPWYAKGQYPDYAPSGMPDFDQKQDAWTNPWPPNPGSWSYCGPTSVANSLWWFDSKYESNPIPPPTYNDGFPLVTTYGFWDDHDPLNAPPLIMDLAWYMDTDGIRTGIPHCGTDVFDMQAGIAHYMSDKGVNPLGDASGDGVVDMTDVNIVAAAFGSVPGDPGWDLRADVVHDNVINQKDLTLVGAHYGEKWGKFYEKTVWMPDFGYIARQIKACEDVVLLLGFWQEVSPGYFIRVGGHFVTAHGIDEADMIIAISDPFQDNAEQGGQGRVIPPPPHGHPPVPPDTVHNDAMFVSHDYYTIAPSPSPGGIWGLPDYNWLSIINNVYGQNTPYKFTEPQEPWMGLPVYVEIEYAVVVSCRGPAVAAGSVDGNVYTLDYMGNLLWTYNIQALVETVVMSEHGEYVVAQGANTGIFVFDGATGMLLWSKIINTVGAGEPDAKTVAISADGSYIVAAALDGLYLYDNLGNQIWKYTSIISPQETGVKISPDGRYIVSCDGTTEINFFSHLRDGIPGWQSTDGSPIWTKHKGHNGLSGRVAIDGCGRYIAFAADDDFDNFGEVYLCDREGTEIWSWESNRQGPLIIDMPWDGSGVVAVNWGGINGAELAYFSDMKNGVLGWQSTDGTPQWIFVPTPDVNANAFYTVSISPDGKVIVAGLPEQRKTYLLSKSGLLIQTIADDGAIASDLTFTGEYGVVGTLLTYELSFFCRTRNTMLWNYLTPSPILTVAIQKKYPCLEPFPNHDVDISNIKRYTTTDDKVKTIVCKGCPANEITITLSNHGNFPETVEVTLYAYSSSNNTMVLIGNRTVTVNPGTTPVVSMTWTSTNVPYYGNYTLHATIGPVQDENNLIDNEFTDNGFLITGLGDVNGDRKCDMKDIGSIAKGFGTHSGDRWYYPNYDINCDYKIDMKDVGMAARYFGTYY